MFSRVTAIALGLTTMSLVLIIGPGAGAITPRSVVNPCSSTTDYCFTFTINPGSSFDVGGRSFTINSTVSVKGTVSSTGAIVIPRTIGTTKNIVFPKILVGYSIYAQVKATCNPHGSISPESTSGGNLKLSACFDVAITGSSPLGRVPSGCAISTFSLHSTTGASGSKTGVAYSETNGNATTVDGTYAFPGANSSCGGYQSIINSQLGLPSASGNNSASLSMTANPIID